MQAFPAPQLSDFPIFSSDGHVNNITGLPVGSPNGKQELRLLMSKPLGFPSTKRTTYPQFHDSFGLAKAAAGYPGGRLGGIKAVFSTLRKPPKHF